MRNVGFFSLKTQAHFDVTYMQEPPQQRAESIALRAMRFPSRNQVSSKCGALGCFCGGSVPLILLSYSSSGLGIFVISTIVHWPCFELAMRPS